MASSAGVRDKAILGPGAKSLGKGPDLSQLKSPIQTSLSGTRQVIHALECGTGEVKEYLLEEINLMYECKTCFSVFRSLANLIAHKRTFCKSKYKDVHHIHRDKYNDGAPPPVDVQTVVIEAEPVECVVDEKDISLDNYAPSVELLKTSGILQDISNKPVINRLLPPRKQGIGQIVNKLKAKIDGKDSKYYENHQRVGGIKEDVISKPPSVTQVVHLEPMYETDSGLMQSWRYSEDGETLGQTYRAWQEAEAEKKCYKVWPNGHVTSTQEIIKLVTGPDGKTYSVRVPFDTFASTEDIDTDDEESGYTKYPCPTCKRSYSKIMNVFKHMVEKHDIEMHEAKAKRKIIQHQAVYVEGRRKKTKAKDNFERPVKPVLVKLKNYTLDSKVPVNLCEKLNAPGNTTCPILSSNCLSDTTKVQETDLEKDNESEILVTEDIEQEKEVEELDKDEEMKEVLHVNRRKSRNPVKSWHDPDDNPDTNGVDDDEDTRDANNDHDEPPVIDIDDDSEVSFKQNGSSGSCSPEPLSPNENQKRKRGSNLASYNVKRNRNGSGGDIDGGSDSNENTSLKIVFSKVSKECSSPSTSVSPTVRSPTESRESSVSRDSNSSFSEISSHNVVVKPPPTGSGKAKRGRPRKT